MAAFGQQRSLGVGLISLIYTVVDLAPAAPRTDWNAPIHSPSVGSKLARGIALSILGLSARTVDRDPVPVSTVLANKYVPTVATGTRVSREQWLEVSRRCSRYLNGAFLRPAAMGQ